MKSFTIPGRSLCSPLKLSPLNFHLSGPFVLYVRQVIIKYEIETTNIFDKWIAGIKEGLGINKINNLACLLNHLLCCINGRIR
jgi:hypothetical protein